MRDYTDGRKVIIQAVRFSINSRPKIEMKYREILINFPQNYGIISSL